MPAASIELLRPSSLILLPARDPRPTRKTAPRYAGRREEPEENLLSLETSWRKQDRVQGIVSLAIVMILATGLVITFTSFLSTMLS